MAGGRTIGDVVERRRGRRTKVRSLLLCEFSSKGSRGCVPVAGHAAPPGMPYKAAR